MCVYVYNFDSYAKSPSMSQLYQFIPPLTDMLLQNVCFEDAAVLHNSIIFLKKTDVCYGKKETNTKLKQVSFNK